MDANAHFAAKPPKRLHLYALLLGYAKDWPRGTFDGHAGDHVNVVRWLGCACGSTLHFVDGDYDDEGGLDSLSTECATCHKSQVLFDVEFDGYNAKVDRLEAKKTSLQYCLVLPKKRIRFKCEGCGSTGLQAYRLCVRVEYARDLLEDEGLRWAAPDWFSWFTAVGKCGVCHSAVGFGDWECA